MSDIVIRAEGLGKKYLIGHQTERERYTALRDVLARNVRDYWRKAQALARGEPIMPGDEQEEIWALREVSFEIRQGEAVGIIGRNGAGKSTLLKILSRITEPSAGRVTIRGRVASLLEVGTGFHPELTGRENIYLNGAILGMTRQEIKHKFDEIVDFAEVEKFLDTPVKRYSSGMYVRLAFAVAAHLEPEILVVDELLSVGDLKFQRKSLGKMEEITQSEGKTILLVSHNMTAVNQLCNKVICLENGTINFEGITHEGINKYYNNSYQSSVNFVKSSANAYITHVQFMNEELHEKCRFCRTEKILVKVYINVYKNYKKLNISMALSHGEIGPIFSESLSDYFLLHEIKTGSYITTFKIDLKYLKPEQYFLTLHLVDLKSGEVAYELLNIHFPEIYSKNIDSILESHRWGVVRIPVEFTQFKKIDKIETIA